MDSIHLQRLRFRMNKQSETHWHKDIRHGKQPSAVSKETAHCMPLHKKNDSLSQVNQTPLQGHRAT